MTDARAKEIARALASKKMQRLVRALSSAKYQPAPLTDDAKAMIAICEDPDGVRATLSGFHAAITDDHLERMKRGGLVDAHGFTPLGLAVAQILKDEDHAD